MAKLEKSRWADKDFAQEYRDNADNYVPDRYRFIEIMMSIYEHFCSKLKDTSVLDLGCGDGLFMHAPLNGFDNIKNTTLVDASPEMLEAAGKRLEAFEGLHFVDCHLQSFKEANLGEKEFDFIYSSLAIHHLNLQEKKVLFKDVYESLKPGGFFLNTDPVLSPTNELDGWYMTLWREWIGRNADEARMDKFLNIPNKYKEGPENQPDTLLSQLDALKRVGFNHVDCFYKFGIFAMFGGSK